MSLRTLPTELYYPICAHDNSRRDLLAIATSSRALQHPAEASLHRTVVLHNHEAGRLFFVALQVSPRFAAFVRDLRVMKAQGSGLDHEEEEEYWVDMKEALAKLSNLSILLFDDGIDKALARTILASVDKLHLRRLRCAFVLDEYFLKFVATQDALEELEWTGSLILVQTSRDTESTDDNTIPDRGAWDPDRTTLPFLRKYLPHNCIPKLHTLRSESLALARALVPGRPVKHLWVPGAGGGSAYVSEHVHERRIAQASRQRYSGSPSQEEEPDILQFALAHTQPTSPTAATHRLSLALRDFAKSTYPGGIRSLRMAFGLPPAELRVVFGVIEETMPKLNALGYISGSALEPAGSQHGGKVGVENDSALLPSLPNLRILCAWSTPSLATTSLLESIRSQGILPSLSTLACLNYSPSFEWLCLPVLAHEERSGNSSEFDDENRRIGCWQGVSGMDDIVSGVPWERERGMSGGRRRPTAVHDPEDLLWQVA